MHVMIDKHNLIWPKIITNPQVDSPMLIRVTLSLAIASKATVILCNFSWLCVGLCMAPWIIFLDRISTRATSITPSSKSVRMSTMDSPRDLSCSFTQFLKVFLWISTHCELLVAASRVIWPFWTTAVILLSLIRIHLHRSSHTLKFQ